MSKFLRLPHLAIGSLEAEILNLLWREGRLNPNGVHARISGEHRSSIKTISSALKRLFEKGLLAREKVSHAYVYRPAVTRAELQRQMIGTLAGHFADGDDAGFLAAFLDLAEERGEATLRRLEHMINQRLGEGDP